MHAKPDLRVVLKWMIAGSGSVIADVMRLTETKNLRMTESDRLENPLEVASELRRFHNEGRPFGFELDDGDCWAEGFVAHVGEDFAILSRLHQRSWTNGYLAIRFSAIHKFGDSGDADFICRAMQARNEEIPPVVPFRPISMVEFLSVVCTQFPIVVVDDAVENNNDSGVAGTIQLIQDDKVHLKTISVDGYWLDGIHTIPVEDIEHVLFGSNYEDTLRLVGEMPPE